MRLCRSLLLAGLLLLLAVPAHGAEELEMECPVCDHVDVSGRGLEPNTTVTLVIVDVRSGQTVLPETRVQTDGAGSFEREFDMDLTRHPSLLANLYEAKGSTLVLAAHTNATAPAHCRRATSLPYTGSSPWPTAGTATALLVVGALLVLAGRRRSLTLR
jgi:LPXTG-motif cell wall-anchored protein